MNFKLGLISALLITGTATTLEAREPVSIQLAQNTVAPLVSGQRVRVKKLTRDMAAVGAQIVTSGPSEFQDAGVVKARQKRLQQFKDALLRYPQLEDPDVIQAREQFRQLQNGFRGFFVLRQAHGVEVVERIEEKVGVDLLFQ